LVIEWRVNVPWLADSTSWDEVMPITGRVMD
jgi:hypothetical protein